MIFAETNEIIERLEEENKNIKAEIEEWKTKHNQKLGSEMLLEIEVKQLKAEIEVYKKENRINGKRAEEYKAANQWKDYINEKLEAQLKIAIASLDNISGFIEFDSGFDHPTTESHIAKQALEQIKAIRKSSLDRIFKAFVVLDEHDRAISYLDESLGKELTTTKQNYERQNYKIIPLFGVIS